jgi:hypothetical protein
MRRLAIALSCGLVCLLPAASARAVTIDPPSGDFGSVTVGATRGPVSFTLTPQGMVDTQPLQGGPGMTFVAYDFTIHNVDCPYPGFSASGSQSTCQFTASLMPTGIGPRSFGMTFGDTIPPMSSATVNLTGTGAAAPAPTTTGQGAAKPKKCKKKPKKRGRPATAAKKCKKKR